MKFIIGFSVLMISIMAISVIYFPQSTLGFASFMGALIALVAVIGTALVLALVVKILSFLLS